MAGVSDSTIYSTAAGNCKYTTVSHSELQPSTVQWFRAVSTPSGPVDLKILSASLTQGVQTAPDSKPFTTPQKQVTVNVLIAGTNITAGDSRLVNLTLSFGSGAKTRTVVSSVALGSLAGGNPVNMPIDVTFLDNEVGNLDLKATINDSKGVAETDFANNSASTSMHVFCDARERSVRPIPFWSQLQTPWGQQPSKENNFTPGYAFGPYGAASKHYMRQYGCYLTDIMMAAGAYGIDRTVKGLYISPDKVISSTPEDMTTLDPGVLDKASWVQTTDGEFALFDKDNNPNGVGIQNYLRAAWAKGCLADGAGSAETCSEQSYSQITFKPHLTQYNPEYVQTQLCMGNPIILALNVPAVPAVGKKRARPAHSHFVLATAQTVDETGAPSYVINDPGKGAGANLRLFAEYPQSRGYFIKSQRVYLHGADPSFFQVRSSEQVQVVVTDPQGRKSGTNPFTGVTYDEIPGVVQYQEESPNEDLNDETPDQVKSNVLVNIDSILDGQYKFDLFSTKRGIANVEIDGYDADGYINQIVPFSQTLNQGQSVQLNYLHKSTSLQGAQLSASRALYIDRRSGTRDDSIYLHGKIELPDSVNKLVVANVFSAKIGPVSKRIEGKYFKRKRSRKGFAYVYRDFRDSVTLIELKRTELSG